MARKILLLSRREEGGKCLSCRRRRRKDLVYDSRFTHCIHSTHRVCTKRQSELSFRFCKKCSANITEKYNGSTINPIHTDNLKRFADDDAEQCLLN